MYKSPLSIARLLIHMRNTFSSRVSPKHKMKHRGKGGEGGRARQGLLSSPRNTRIPRLSLRNPRPPLISSKTTYTQHTYTSTAPKKAMIASRAKAVAHAKTNYTPHVNIYTFVFSLNDSTISGVSYTFPTAEGASPRRANRLKSSQKWHAVLSHVLRVLLHAAASLSTAPSLRQVCA